MKLFILVISLFLSIAAFSTGAHATIIYPYTPPDGEPVGGTFNTYFSNMFRGPCVQGEVIQGFTLTGVIICTPVSARTSLDTLAFSGSLIGTEGYIPRYSADGTGIVDSQIYDNGINIGIGTITPGTRLDVVGDIRANGVRVGRGVSGIVTNTLVGEQSFLTNISGLYNTVIGYSAGNSINIGSSNTLIGSNAGSNITLGNNNITLGVNTNVVSATASNQLNIGNWIYGSGGHIGIGIAIPLSSLHISSGTPGVSGLRLQDLIATSAIFTGMTTPIGVDGSGNIVNTVAGNIPVYTGLGGTPTALVNNSVSPPTIGADYNKYFTIPVRQSFVVTDVGGQPSNAPNFAINGATNRCSGGGCQTPWATYMMTAQNSTTASSRYAYQIMISDRVDAPFVVRGGTYYNSTQDIMNTAGTVSALWFKALTVPTNHAEYFYINPGVDQNSNPIAGGGNIGIGTATPTARLDVSGNWKLGAQGAVLTAIQKLSIANDIPSIAADSGSLRTFTFANAALGGSVIISPASALPDGVIIAYARVSVAGTVEVKFRNVTTAAIDPPNINYNITIIQ